MLIQIHRNRKLIEKCWGGHGQKMGVATLVSGLQNGLCLKNELME